MEPRRLRAVVTVCAVLIATAVAYLHPLLPLGRSTPQASPAAPRTRAPMTQIVTYISFGDADHGAVTLSRPTVGTPPASIWLTADGGRTWRRFPAQSAPDAVVFDSPRHALAETLGRDGSMITADGGRTWQPLSLPSQGWLTFLDAVHAWLFAEGTAGAPPLAVWRTSDGGASWQRLSDVGALGTVPKGLPLFVDPQHGLLVVGTSEGGSVSLLATEDGGVSWQRVATFGSPLPGAYLLSTRIFAHGGTLLVVPLWVTGAVVGPGGAGVQIGPDAVFHPFVSVSDDAGRTWSPLRAVPSSAFNGPVGGPTLDDHGRLVMFDRGRLWVSEDSGTTWRAPAAALPWGMEAAGTIIAAPGALFVAARVGGGLAPPTELLRSRDGGSHWSMVPLPKVPV